jgi:hypothetical protein
LPCSSIPRPPSFLFKDSDPCCTACLSCMESTRWDLQTLGEDRPPKSHQERSHRACQCS